MGRASTGLFLSAAKGAETFEEAVKCSGCTEQARGASDSNGQLTEAGGRRQARASRRHVGPRSIVVFERVGLWAAGQQLEPHLIHIVALQRTPKDSFNCEGALPLRMARQLTAQGPALLLTCTPASALPLACQLQRCQRMQSLGSRRQPGVGSTKACLQHVPHKCALDIHVHLPGEKAGWR